MAVTREQALTEDEFHRGECVRTHGPRGGIDEQIEQWRRNGATKTWKHEPDRFRVPVKYGMRGYSYLDDTNAEEFHLASQCPLEETEYRARNGDGSLTLALDKTGGGTLGRRYTGDWKAVVTDTEGRIVVDGDLGTGTPKNHNEVAEMVWEFVAEGEV